MSVNSVPVRDTDLFPTRYEAFDTPGVVFVFKPEADGTFWHCRRDGKRSNMRDFLAPKVSELAVYSGPEGYFEIGSAKQGFYVRASWKEQNFWHGMNAETLEDGILMGCKYLGLVPSWENTKREGLGEVP